ncbi:hypothetical protein [Sulfobacillus harzensis]|uniref:PrgI family protein n=1 Tax=Sulfobacillus harzensis TaxID=2729629 RepID=A0A7Y0Q5I6_9FIRM|nr:hypothetical protein [Sulfobacillus harzensis]NMP24349.1 hypothetical protein [Sulfobacillus harzensis]
MARYLIPKPIQRQYELFPGWGFPQIGLVVAGLLVGGMLFLVLTLFHVRVPIRLIAFVLPLGIAGFLAFPPPNDQPLYQRLQAGVGFSKSTRKWLYDWNASDWPE